MQDKLNEKLTEIFKKCLELNSENFHVFVRYSGHIDSLGISVIKGGWSSVENGGSVDNTTSININYKGETPKNSWDEIYTNIKIFEEDLEDEKKYLIDLDKVIPTLERLKNEADNGD